MQKIIEKLASKATVIEEHKDGTKIFILNPVYIGDIMKAIKDKKEFYGDYMVGLDGTIFYAKNGESPYAEVAKWPDTSKSLQEIAEESGYAYLCFGCNDEECKLHCNEYVQRLKDPNARKLEQFLNQILNEPN